MSTTTGAGMADKGNTALGTLKVVTWLCVGVGVVLLIIGIVGHHVSEGPYDFSTGNNTPLYGPLIAGASLLGIAFQGWLLLLLFWALQWDRATRASYTPPMLSEARAAEPNRVQRAAVQPGEKIKPGTWRD